MDPLTFANSLATVVSLLVNFRSVRSEGTLSEFMSWLREQQKEDLAQFIAQNKTMSGDISELLAVNHHDLAARIDSLNRKMSKVAVQVEALSNIQVHETVPYINASSISVEASNSSISVSHQAQSVIRQIVATKTNLVIEVEDNSGTFTYICGGGSIGVIQIAEPRFIKDDFDNLIKLKFLKVEYDNRGARSFIPTRLGVSYVSNLADA